MNTPKPLLIAAALASRTQDVIGQVLESVPLISRNLLDARSTMLLDSDAILRGKSRVLVVAPPGSGKTTLLRMLANRMLVSWDQTAGATQCPIFIRAINLDREQGDQAFLTVDCVALSLTAAIDALGPSRCTLIIDGLDEAPSPTRAANWIAELTHRHPALSALVSCRPGTYREALSTFETFTLAPLAPDQTSDFIAQLFPDNVALRNTFVEALRAYPALDALAANPFILRMAAETFRQSGLLPKANPAEMMKDLIDHAIDAVPENEAFPLPIIDDRLAALGKLATSLYAKGQSVQPVDELLSDQGLQRRSQESFVMQRWLKQSGLLHFNGEDIGFAHKSVMEFFVAWHFRDDAAGLGVFLSDLDDFSSEVLRYAAGLIDELGPLIEPLIYRGQLLLAANCVAWGKSRNTALADHIIDLIERALEPRIFSQMLHRVQERRVEPALFPPAARDRYDTLLDLFDRSIEEVPNHERGQRFEEFTNALFNGVFEPVSMNYRTEHGEIDIVMENVGQGHFWGEYGGDIFIECKNLKNSAEAHMVHTFASKASLAGRKLAFFVSLHGFSAPALAAIRTKSLMTGHTLLVPLCGEEIRNALLRRVDLENFFKDQIRKVRHQGT